MKTLLLSLSLVNATEVQNIERPRDCKERSLCTMEYKPAKCWVEDFEELTGFGDNKCRAWTSLQYQLCRQNIEVEPEDIICVPLLQEQLN